MKSTIHFTNGNTLQLDEYATDMLLRSIHKQELNNSLTVIHFGDKTGKFRYTVPMNSVSYIEYLDQSVG